MPTSLSLEKTETNALALVLQNGVPNEASFSFQPSLKYLLVDQLLSLERSPRSLGSFTVCKAKAKRTGVRREVPAELRQRSLCAMVSPISLTVRVLNGHLEGLIFGL